MAKYFGTNGIRGKMDSLTPEFCSRMSAAFANYVRAGKILIGRDTRITGEMLRNAVVAGLLSAGSDVLDLGVVPSPTLEFLVPRLNASGGVIITASHNPPEWNALKFADKDGVDISRERGEEIERIFDCGPGRAAWDKVGSVQEHPSAIKEHIRAILKFVDTKKLRKKKLSVVLDCGNGTASLMAPQLFRELGCTIATLNSQPDGHFPGRSSEPTMENVRDLIESVRALGADMGVAWDGDADRVIFIDEKGGYVIGDKSFALCVETKLREKKGIVITTVATSNVVKKICAREGGKLVYTKVGAPYLAEKMRELKALMGGEEVGGVIWPEISFGKDGLMSAAKIAERVCGESLSKIVGSLPIYYNHKIKIPVEAREKEPLLKKLLEIAKGKGDKANSIDGVRIDMGDEWCITRASGTENYMRIFAEARSRERAEALVEAFRKRLETARESI